MDENGEARGVYVDLLTEIFEKELGYELEYRNVPWKRAQYLIQNGSSDIIVTLPTKERLEYTIPSKLPLIELSLNVFTYTNHPKLKQINEIKSAHDIKRLALKPVTNIGNGWQRNEIDSHGIITEYVPTEENAFQMIASRRADITIEPTCAGTFLIKKLGLEEKVVPTSAFFGPLNFHILLSKKSKYYEQMETIDMVLETLTLSGRLDKIISAYKQKKMN